MRKASTKRHDGFANILSGVGTSKDPRAATRFIGNLQLDSQTLDDLYQFSGLSRRIVDCVPDLMTRDPWSIESDTDNAIWGYLDQRGAVKALRTGMKWARLYGGAVVVMIAQDGSGDLETPLNPTRIKTLEEFRVYDRWSIMFVQGDYQRDPSKPRYGQREFYTIQPRASAFGSTQTFRVHHSRVLAMDGRGLPDTAKARNQDWGDSELTAVLEEVQRYCESLGDSAIILRDFVQGVMTVKNLTEMMSTPEGEELVKRRLNILDMSRHVLNTMLLDEGETYSKQISSVSGIGDVLDRLAAAVSSVVGIPQTILFGRSPSGLNASGDNETRAFYDVVSQRQREDYAPHIMRLCELVSQASDAGKAKIAGPHKVAFKSLWMPTEKEQADTRKVVAETDGLYISNGVLDPVEVAESRFGGRSYSMETKLTYDRSAPAAEAEPDDEEDVGQNPARTPKTSGQVAAP